MSLEKLPRDREIAIEVFMATTLETLQELKPEVKRNHDDILIIKTRILLYSSIFGFCGGLIGILLKIYVIK